MWFSTVHDHADRLLTQIARVARIPGTQFGAHAGILLGLSATFLIWFGAFYFIRGERRQTEQAAFLSSRNLTRAFEEQIIRSIRAVDQTLLYVRDSYSKDPDHFDMSLWSRNSQFLTDFMFQIAILDRNGMLVASNMDPNPNYTRLDFSDREHFKFHLGRDTDELYISRPVVGRVSGKWSIQLTRRISAADGSFAGVVVVSLDPDYFARFYDTIDVGEHGSVTLVGTDGIVRARSPPDRVIGTSFRDNKLFERLAVAQAGALYINSQSDGAVRMLSYRQVRGYPLIVVVGLGRDDIFSAFDRHRTQYLLTAGMLTAWLLAMTMVILRYERGLTKARDAAQAGTRARSEFLAMMSHEIRTPMNGVIGMTELLLDSGLQGEQEVFANTLRDSAEYLLQLIDDVLDFSKLDAGRVELEKIPFDVRDLVQRAVDSLTPRASVQHIFCAGMVAPDVPRHVMGDPARIRQVLLNLIGNAVKFTKAGGVTIVVEADSIGPSGRVRLSFRVKDTGIGIPADAVGLLFREFSQLDNSISRRFGGTGLGLAICKRLVALMGGEIGVESELGRGSVFHFTIDVEPAAAPAAEIAGKDAGNWQASPSIVAGEAPAASKPWRILVAEDNRTNQVVIRKLLATSGRDADIVRNGVEAVAACAATQYDLVLMDVTMPEMNGLAATKAIRDLPEPNRSVHIVALTANVFPEDREKCRAAGMDGFLAKPVTRKSLDSVLRSFADRLVAEPASAPDAPVVAGDDAAVFEPSVYDELSEALGADDALKVLGIFLEDAKQRLEVLGKAASQGDNETIAREAHTLKSSAATLGFMRLSRLARDLEADAETAVEPVAAARIAALSEDFASVSSLAHHMMLSATAAAVGAIR